MKQLIDDEQFVSVNLSLVGLLDSECAIILSQLHFWLQVKEQNLEQDYFFDGRYWTYNSLRQWKKQFPCYTEDLIKRKLKKMRDMGILLTSNHNKLGADRTLWYSIDYVKLNELLKDHKRKIHFSISGKSTNALVENPPTNTNNIITSNIITSNINTINNKDLKSKGVSEELPKPETVFFPQGIADINFDVEVVGDSSWEASPMTTPEGFSDSASRSKKAKGTPDGVHDYSNAFWKSLVAKVTASANRLHLPADTANIALKEVCSFMIAYRNCFGETHPMISQPSMDNIVRVISEVRYDSEDLKLMREEFFRRDIGNDHHISLFFTPEILTYRAFEIGLGMSQSMC